MKPIKAILFIALAMAAFPFWGMQTATAQQTWGCDGTMLYFSDSSYCVDYSCSDDQCIQVELNCSINGTTPGTCGIYFNGNQPAQYVIDKGCQNGSHQTGYILLPAGDYTICLDSCPGTTATLQLTDMANCP